MESRRTGPLKYTSPVSLFTLWTN